LRNTIQVYVAVRLPAVGEYGLEIYACKPRRDGDTFTHICQYLVVFADREFGALYSELFDQLDVASGTQVDPVRGQFESSQCNGTARPPRENIMYQDSAPAKDRQLQVRKDDVFISIVLNTYFNQSINQSISVFNTS